MMYLMAAMAMYMILWEFYPDKRLPLLFGLIWPLSLIILVLMLINKEE